MLAATTKTLSDEQAARKQAEAAVISQDGTLHMMEADLAEKSAEAKARLEQIAGLEASLSAAGAAKDKLAEEKASALATIAELENKVESLRGVIADARQNITELEESKASQAKKIKARSDATRRQEALLNSRKKELAELGDRAAQDEAREAALELQLRGSFAREMELRRSMRRSAGMTKATLRAYNARIPFKMPLSPASPLSPKKKKQQGFPPPKQKQKQHFTPPLVDNSSGNAVVPLGIDDDGGEGGEGAPGDHGGPAGAVWFSAPPSSPDPVVFDKGL